MKFFLPSFRRSLSSWTVILCAAALAFLSTNAPGATPETVLIQGQLLDSQGAPLEGTREYRLRFFDSNVVGNQLGGEIYDVTTLSPEGLFQIVFILPQEALDAVDVWYEVAVDSSPDATGLSEDDNFPDRIRLHSVPFARLSDRAREVELDGIGDGSVSESEFNALAGVTGPLQSQLDAKAEDADLGAHLGNTGNPHSVTAEQVGLGNVDNTADADKPISGAAQAALDAKAEHADLGAHLGDTGNPHGVTAEQVGLGNVDNTADADKPISTMTQETLDTKLAREGAAYVVVETTDDPFQNGANLLAAYAEAAARTPHGAALDAENRAVVLVPPGEYELDGSPLTMDTDFVDLVGLSTARENQHIFRDDDVLVQTARDVRIENLLLHYTGTSLTTPAYFPDATWNTDHNGSPPETVIRNCEFRVDFATRRSMRSGVEYAGFYEDCQGGGSAAFGGGGTASGTFINCAGGNDAFGGAGTASGTFINCTGGSFAFGGDRGTASGTFTNCTGGMQAFGGNGGTAEGGEFFYCNGGDGSFTTTGDPSILYCIRNGEAFP